MLFIFAVVMTDRIVKDSDLKEVSIKIKALYPNWIVLVAQGISKEKDWKNWTNNDCTEDNARHISKGVIKGQMHRRLFMKVSAKLLLDAAQQVEGINETLQQVEGAK